MRNMKSKISRDTTQEPNGTPSNGKNIPQRRTHRNHWNPWTTVSKNSKKIWETDLFCHPTDQSSGRRSRKKRLMLWTTTIHEGCRGTIPCVFFNQIDAHDARWWTYWVHLWYSMANILSTLIILDGEHIKYTHNTRR